MPEDYLERKRRLEAQLLPLLQASNRKLKRCYRTALEAAAEEMNEPDFLKVLSPGLELHLNDTIAVEVILSIKNDAYKELDASLRKCRNAPTDPSITALSKQLEDLEREAEESQIRAGYMVIADSTTAATAQPIRDAHGALYFETDTWSQVKNVLLQERFVNVLVIVLPTRRNELRIGGQWRTLSQIAKDLKGTKLHVDDVIQIGASAWQSDPPGEEALRKLFGAGALTFFEITAAPEPQEVSEKCRGTFATAGPGYKDALGIIAHALVAKDYEKRLRAERKADLFVDDQMAGPKNPEYIRWLLQKNPRLSRKQKQIIQRGGYKRPDLVLHQGQRKELEETKPNTDSGIRKGIEELKEYRKWMRARGLPYEWGTSYISPPQEYYIPILSFRLPTIDTPVEFRLKVQRGKQDGLIVYLYCIRADFKKIIWRLLISALLLILAFILRRIGVPVTPILPPPIPNPVIPKPPDRIPVPALVMAEDVTLAKEFMAALESLSEEDRRDIAILVEADGL